MKSAYIIPLSIIFLILGSAVGFLAKEVYEKQKPKEKQASPWLEELSAFEDADFMHSFEGLQDQLTETERALGQKLIACIVEKQKMQSEIVKVTQEKEEQEESQKTFIARFLGKTEKEDRPTIPGKVIPMFDAETQNPIPFRIVDQRYKQIFPNVSFQHQQEEGFGYYDQAVTDIDAFLEKRIVKNPGMSVVDMQRKKRSKFFQSLRTAAFEGNVDIYSEGADNKHFAGKLIFRSPTQSGLDWIVISDDEGATIETRTWAYEDESIWRYNSQNPSVILLSEQCQWNDQYVYEYKDFFYLSQSNMLVANIYCKKQNSNTWDRVGTLKFEQIAE